METKTEICYELIVNEDRMFFEYIINKNIDWLSKVAFSIIKNYNIHEHSSDVYYYIYLAFLNLKKIKKEMFLKYWFKKLILFLIKQQMIIQIRKSTSNKNILWKRFISFESQKEHVQDIDFCDEESLINKLNAKVILDNNINKIKKLKSKERSIFYDYYINNYNNQELLEKYNDIPKTTMRGILDKLKRTLRSFKTK